MTDNIKEMFVLLAKYNEMTNNEVMQLLEGVTPAKLSEDVGSYYKSIMGMLNHQMMADIRWLRAITANIPELGELESSLKKLITVQSPPNTLQWKSLDEYKNTRTKLDATIREIVKTIPPERYTSILKLEDHRGKIEYVLWRILLHLFNHHTHHRGGIAVLLDQINVENDYSNLLWKV